MEKVKQFVIQGKTKEALETLLSLVNKEAQKEVRALMARFNAHTTAINKGTLRLDETIVNQIHEEILSICDRYELNAKRTVFAQPPYLDNLPCDAEGYLLGRKAALEELHTALLGNGILTLVNGIGGIGKSTLAAFYAHFPAYKKAYAQCFWIAVSDTKGNVTDSLIATFAAALDLYKKPKDKQLDAIKDYLLGLGGEVLLIIDNANEPKQLTAALDFLRKCKCNVLVTTRANVTGMKALPLATLLPEDAFTLFTHYFPAAKNLPEMPQLLKNIAYHTLLTEFMAKSLAHNPVLSLQHLLDLTVQQNFTDELLTYTQFTSYHTHTHGKADTKIAPAKYLIEIFPTQKLNEEEQKLLRYFSILPAEWIGIAMLKQLFVERSVDIKYITIGFQDLIINLLLNLIKLITPNPKQDTLKLGQTLQQLYEKGWLQKSPDNEFSCHVLLQHILRQQLKPNEENCKVLLTNLFIAIRIDGYTNKIILSSYLPLIESVLSWIKKDIEPIANLYNNSATIYEAIGDYTKSLVCYLRSIDILEKISVNNKLYLADVYNNTANIYNLLKNYEEALKYYLKSKIIYEKILVYNLKPIKTQWIISDNEHPDLAISYHNIANTYRALNDNKEALAYYLKAIKIREKVLNNEHPDLAISYHNIANVYYYSKKYKIAYFYVKKAVEIRTKALPKGHPDIKESLQLKLIIKKATRRR